MYIYHVTVKLRVCKGAHVHILILHVPFLFCLFLLVCDVFQVPILFVFVFFYCSSGLSGHLLVKLFRNVMIRYTLISRVKIFIVSYQQNLRKIYFCNP